MMYMTETKNGGERNTTHLHVTKSCHEWVCGCQAYCDWKVTLTESPHLLYIQIGTCRWETVAKSGLSHLYPKWYLSRSKVFQHLPHETNFAQFPLKILWIIGERSIRGIVYGTILSLKQNHIVVFRFSLNDSHWIQTLIIISKWCHGSIHHSFRDFTWGVQHWLYQQVLCGVSFKCTVFMCPLTFECPWFKVIERIHQ